eukprot:IDg20642t1
MLPGARSLQRARNADIVLTRSPPLHTLVYDGATAPFAWYARGALAQHRDRNQARGVEARAMHARVRCVVLRIGKEGCGEASSLHELVSAAIVGVLLHEIVDNLVLMRAACARVALWGLLVPTCV